MNIRKNIRNYFRFTILKENLEQDTVDYNRKNIQKIYKTFSCKDEDFKNEFDFKYENTV